MDRFKGEFPDKGVEPFQVCRVMNQAFLPFLQQMLRGGIPPRSLWPHTICTGLSDLLQPVNQVSFCFSDLTSASAFSKSDFPDIFLDVPDATAFDKALDRPLA